MKYSLNIFTATSADDVRHVVDVRTGSLSLVAFAAKEAKAELDSAAEATEFRVELTELDSEGRGSKVLLGMTADGETIGDTLKVRLSKLRKAEKDALDASAPERPNYAGE